jgi:hypothetical protein
MQRNGPWGVLIPIVVAGLSAGACQRAPEAAEHVAPAHVEHIEGQEVSRVTLTRKAAERLDLTLDVVREQRVARSGAVRKVVPYGSVLYDPTGRTWVYTSPDSLVFVRAQIVIEYIEGDLAVLTDGPPVGTRVVTLGATELHGAEFEIGH